MTDHAVQLLDEAISLRVMTLLVRLCFKIMLPCILETVVANKEIQHQAHTQTFLPQNSGPTALSCTKLTEQIIWKCTHGTVSVTAS